MFGFGKGSRELNLIPEEERKLRTKKIRVITMVLIGFVLVMQILTFAGIFVLEQREKGITVSLEKELAEKNNQWKQISEPAEHIKVTKNKLSTFNSFLSTQVDPNSNIDKVQKVLPLGVTLITLGITKENKVTLNGTVDKPEVIYQLYNLLQDREKEFDEIKLKAIDKVAENSYTFIIGFILK